MPRGNTSFEGKHWVALVSISDSRSGWFYDDAIAMKIWNFNAVNERLSMMHGNTVDLVKQMIEGGFVALFSSLGETTCSFGMPFPSTPSHRCSRSLGAFDAR